MSSLTTEVFKNTFTSKEKTLVLWQFLNDNRVHYYPPNWDAYVNYNMLMCYGYGTCDIVTWDARLFMQYIGYSTNSSYMVHHTVANIHTSGNDYLLDSDMKVFYLNYDNSNLVGFNDVLNDKYLIYRTKHYGKNIKYDKAVDKWVSRLYYQEYLNKKNFEGIKGWQPPIYDFTLRPGERVEYSWDETKMYVQNWGTETEIPTAFAKNIIANGEYIYSNNFKTAELSELFDDYKNIATSSPAISPHIYASNDSAYFIISVNSPFPIVDAYLKGNFIQNSINDSIEVFWSSDNNIWAKKWLINEVGNFSDSINFQSQLLYIINNQSLPLTYNYYLKFLFHKANSDSIDGVDSLYIENTFLTSRFFLPTLVKGINQINYSDYNGTDTLRNLEIKINWQETNENHPPSIVQDAIFPKNGATVDSLYFGFSWVPATDVDGDQITDYEFFLSDRPDMLYPLSPNFNLYVSALGDGANPYYKVKETGWLNDGTTYYWKVRAKDSRGAWGDWSQIWNFTPKGVMQPVDLKYEFKNDSLLLSWRRNSSGKLPDCFKIYGSDEAVGFVPDAKNIIGLTRDSSFIIQYNGGNALKTFYRVSACTNDGQESLPSNYISIPYPYLYSKLDTLVPGKTFKFELAVNEKFRPLFYYGEDTIFYQSKIVFDTIPYWLTVSIGNIVSGLPDYELSRKINFIDSLSKIVLRVVNDSSYEKKYIFKLISSIKNNPPSLFLNDSIATTGKVFNSYITTKDGDFLYGDKNYLVVLTKPSWLNCTIGNDTIFLFGLPVSGDNEDNIIKVNATDSKGASVTRDFKMYYDDFQIAYVVPNPVYAEASIFINLNAESIVSVDLYSITGIKLGSVINQQFKAGENIIPFMTSNLKPNIYILKIKILNINDKITRPIGIKFMKI